VAIVGAGLIGRKRASSLDPRQRLAVVVDTDLDRAHSLAAEYGAAFGAKVEEGLAMLPPGSLVVVATTHAHLAEVARNSVEAGHHVLIEKPGARSAAELRPVASRAREFGLTARVGYNHRFHDGLLRLHDAVTGPGSEPVRVVRARYGHGGRPGYEKEWRASKRLSGGGELLDQGSHLLDLTRYLAGGINEVATHLDTLFWDMEVEDNAFITGRLPSGGRAWLHASWSEWKNLFSVEVFCRTVKYEVEGLGGSYGPEVFREARMLQGFGPPQVTAIQFPPGDNSWRSEMTDVESAIRGETGRGATVDDALSVLELVDGAYGR
jgi:predicted dehydrogenase